MYLDTAVKIPDVKGKITLQKKGKATYVQYEYDRIYLPDKQYTTVSRASIGKLADADKMLMWPNENYVKYFPGAALPEVRDRTQRSCGLRIGTWIVIRKIVNEYNLPEILERYIPARDVGLFLDLAAYSIIEEDNRAQHYPSYAYSHPLFTEGMRIYSDSKISSFLQEMGEEAGADFLNDWNENRDHREKIYASYDSTSKKSSGDLRIVEMGHSKDDEETDIFNYSIAYDTKNREPLFYEVYPGSINDMSQLQCMVDKAKGYGYRQMGFILDRGYFSKDNISYLEDNGYSFVMMLKGKADLVREWVLENKGTFETNRANNIPEYRTYGKTIRKKIFATDKEKRYVHLYHSSVREANERGKIEDTINRHTDFLRKHINQFKDFGPKIESYFELTYEENARRKGEDNKEQVGRKFVFFEERAYAIETELNLCGYFVIITSDKMTAKEALELYKGRDSSEKLFLSDKTFLGNSSLRVGGDESAAAKIFVEFVALIIRNRMYNYLREELKAMPNKPDYMSVPAAIRELDKIEMARQLDGVYRLDHAVTAKQKTILKAFDLTEENVKYRAEEISKRLETGN